jgi:hypothetical protein
VEPTQFGPTDAVNLCLRAEGGDRIQSPKLCFQIKDGTMDNIRNCYNETFLNMEMDFSHEITQTYCAVECGIGSLSFYLLR